MCDIIDQIESNGIDLAHFQQMLNRPSEPMEGKWSTQSLQLIVLGAVEDAWKRRYQDDQGILEDRMRRNEEGESVEEEWQRRTDPAGQ